MISPRVNYLLAACSHRAFRDHDAPIKGKDVLKLHLKQLLLTDLSAITQITVIRILPLERGAFSQEYWDIEDLLIELKTKTIVEILDVKDAWWSYSAWIQACQKYKTSFDYYILIEDDFYPSNSNFANLLIALHQERLPNGGFLCSFYYMNHAALSNGIVDSRSFYNGISKFTDPISAIAPAAQTLFSQLFFDHCADFSDKYKCLSFRNKIIELSHNSDSIINPIQYLQKEDYE